MAIIDSFDSSSQAVISPEQMVTPIDGFPDTMVVTFQARTFAVLMDLHETTALAEVHLEESIELTSQSGKARLLEYQGHRLGALLSPLGAPGAVAGFEKAIALGTKKFVVFGTCGGLVPHLDEGGLIVPTAAYRDEGTSYHYVEASDYIDQPTAQRTAQILTELNIPHTLGRVWTTDAFFRETQNNMAARVGDGCIAVDMETSALAALAQFRGVDVYQFLYTADTLVDAAWDARIFGRLPAEPRARYVQTALEIAVRV